MARCDARWKTLAARKTSPPFPPQPRHCVFHLDGGAKLENRRRGAGDHLPASVCQSHQRRQTYLHRDALGHVRAKTDAAGVKIESGPAPVSFRSFESTPIGDDLPDEDHIVPYIKPTGISEDGTVDGSEFRLRPNRPDDTGASVQWLECYHGLPKIEHLAQIRAVARLTLRKKGWFAAISVGRMVRPLMASIAVKRPERDRCRSTLPASDACRC